LADVEDFDLEKADGLYSGLSSVDDIVYKFLFGSVAIITGKRGSGKSSLLNQIFINEALNQGYDVFCYSGELDARVLRSWIEINMAGSEHIIMKNNFVHIINKDTSQQIKQWYDNRIWVYDENTNDYSVVLSKAITTTKKYGTKIWILDNLMTLDIGAKEADIYQKQKDFIVELVNMAALYNVLIILVIHPRKTSVGQIMLTGDDISGSGDLGNMAQYILSVHRYTDDEKKGEPDNRNGGYKKGKEPVDFDVRLDILKNRYTGKLGGANLYFSYPDYRFYSTAKELYKRLKWNTDTSPMPTSIPRNHSLSENLPDFME
jgi:twinkle protein